MNCKNVIISHKYKFIFIKTHKTAGTSIEVELSDVCGRRDVFTSIGKSEPGHRERNWRGLFNPWPEIRDSRGRCAFKTIVRLMLGQRYYNHIPAYQIRGRTAGQVWREYFKFCVVRNPWDRALSQYHQVKEARGLSNFDEYLYSGRLAHNLYLYTEPGDCKKILVDRIIEYEDLNDGLCEVFNLLGVPFEGALQARAKAGYRKARSDWRDELTRSQADIISEIFKDEIELHRYEQ